MSGNCYLPNLGKWVSLLPFISSPDLFDNYWRRWPRVLRACVTWELIWAWLCASHHWFRGVGVRWNWIINLSIFFPYIFQSYISHAMTLLILLWAPSAWSINHRGDNAKYVSRKDDSFTNDHFNELLYHVPVNHGLISVHYFFTSLACSLHLGVNSLKEALKLSWVSTSSPIIRWYFHRSRKIVIKRCSTLSPGCCDVF